MSLFNEFIAKFGLKAQQANCDAPDLVILEERVLYNASPLPVDLMDTGGEPDLEGSEPEPQDYLEILDRQVAGIGEALDSLHDDSFTDSPETTITTQELVVIDSSVENYQLLVDDILKSADGGRNFELLIVDSTADGIDQVSKYLENRRGLDALHLVTHGEEAAIQLGNSTISLESLLHVGSQISEWQYALSRDADIMIYGCEVAETADGEQLIEQLSLLTDTDVAASDDRTGHHSFSADWDFEVQVGTVETAAAFSLQVQSDWLGELYQIESSAENGAAQGYVLGDSLTRYVALTESSSTSDGSDVLVGIVASNGDELVAPFVANTTTAGDQKWATIAVSEAADRLVVVWTSDDLAGNLGVFATVFDTSGEVIQSQFQIDQVGSNGNDASVVMAADGSFVVTWEGSGVEDGQGIYARQFDQNGSALSGQFSVNAGMGVAGLQSNADIAIQDNGQFIIAWDDRQDSNTLSEIFYKKYDATGNVLFAGTSGTFPSLIAFNPSIDIAADGSFVIAATTDATDTTKSIAFAGIGDAATLAGEDVRAITFDAAGNAQNLFTVSQTTTGSQRDVTALIFDNGVTAFSWDGEGSSGDGVYLRLFDNNDNPLTAESTFTGASEYDLSTDLSSPERNATILNPNDPGYVTWNSLGNGIIAKAGPTSFAAAYSGAGYNNEGQLVEGFHFSDGFSVGDVAPTIDPAPALAPLYGQASNGTIVYDVEATDTEGSTLAYAIVGGDPNGVFGIDGDGRITVVDDTTLDSVAQYSLVVAVTDGNGSGLSVAKTVNVEINDLFASDLNKSINEDQPYSFSPTDFADNNGDSATRIVVTQLPSAGSILLNGNAVAVGNEIDLTVVDEGKLTYVPASNSSQNISLGFRIGDADKFATYETILNIEVVAKADKNFVAVGDQLESLGGPALVNETINGSQGNGKIAALELGGYVVLWESVDNDFTDGDQGTQVFQQLFDSDGTKVGSETLVANNISGDQTTPSVASLNDGGYVATWTQKRAGQTDIFGQRFDASGNPISLDGLVAGSNTEFQVNTLSDQNQFGPHVTQLSDGGFAIAWSSLDPLVDGDQAGISVRTFNSNGVPASEFAVNQSSLGNQRDVTITSLDDNRFVVGWVDQQVNLFDVKARVFDAGDPESGVEFTINSETNNRQSDLVLTSLIDGGFVATWQSSEGQDGSGRGTFGQLFDDQGATRGNEFLINEKTNGHQGDARVTALADGGFLAIYTSSVGDVDGSGIFGRRFDENAKSIGSEFSVNESKYGNQIAPEIETLNDGTLAIAWMAADGDSLGSDFETGVYVDRFDFAVNGDEDSAIGLALDTRSLDSDGSESLELEIHGIPAGAVLSDDIGNSSVVGESWVDVTSWDLSSIKILPAADSHEDFKLEFRTTTQESSNGDQQTVSQELRVQVNPTVDTLSKLPILESTAENQSVDIPEVDLLTGVINVDAPPVTILPNASFDSATLPPSNTGPNLVWENSTGGGIVQFDAGVNYLRDSGSLIAGITGAFEFDGSAGGQISQEALGDILLQEGGIELWIKPATTTGQHVLLDWGDENGGVTLLQDGNQVVMHIHFPNSVNGFTTQPYTLVAEGLRTADFNQIHLSFAGGPSTPLGDSGASPDVQLYLNGNLADRLVDLPGYTELDFTSISPIAAIGTRIGNAVGDDIGFSNFEGLLGRVEVYDAVSSEADVESRYWYERSVPKVINVAGQNYLPGSVIDLPSTAQVMVNHDGSLTYHPNGAFLSLNAGQTGADSFQYEIRNANGSELVTVDLTITGVDPVAPNDLSTGVEINADGNAAYFLADNGEVISGQDELTVELMFRSSQSSDAALLSYQTTDQADGSLYHDDFLIEYRSNGTLDVYLPGNMGTPTLSGLSGIDYSQLVDGDLHNLGFSWSSETGDWKVFVDGVVTDQGGNAAQGEEIVSGGQLVLGQDQNSPNSDFESSKAFHGTFYDVRIWDHLRTDYQIASRATDQFVVGGLPSGLLANWQFDALIGAGNDSVSNIADPGNALTVQQVTDVGFVSGTVKSSLEVSEDTSGGTSVGFVVPQDRDGRSLHQFSLSDTAGGRFQIDPLTGEISVNLGALFDYESDDSHTIDVIAIDADGLDYEETITIKVVDINEQATVSANTGVSIRQFDSDIVITNSMLQEGDPDTLDSGDQVTFTLTSLPTQGQLRVDNMVLGLGGTFTQADIDSGLLRYDHTSSGFANDSFDFTVEDGLEDGVGKTPGSFAIYIAADNPPTSSSITIPILEGTPYAIAESDFGFVDIDGDTFDGIVVVTAPTNGQLIADGTVVADGDTISQETIQTGNLIFVPTGDEFGTSYATVEFQVNSSRGVLQHGTNQLTFDVTNDGTDLVLGNDNYNVNEQVELVVGDAAGVLLNDDADSGVFQVASFTQPSNGTVSVSPNGGFTYTPNFGFFGSDSFTYTVDSTPPLTATVDIEVIETNYAPVVYDNVYGVEVGGQKNFSLDRGVLYSAFDDNGDNLSATVSNGPDHGTLALQPDGTFTYQHNGSATSSDSFTYVVSDNQGGTATATIQLHIDHYGLVDGSEFLVNEDTSVHPGNTNQGTQQVFKGGNSSVAVHDNGDYVVVWHSEGSDGQIDLMMRMYDFSGRPISDQMEVSQDSTQDHGGGSVAMDGNGNFVVTWISRDGSSEFDVFARRFDANGTAIGNAFRVTDDSLGTMTDDFDHLNQLNPSVSMNDSGEFAISWSGGRMTPLGEKLSDIYVRTFAVDGTPEDIVTVNQSGGGLELEKNPTVVIDDAGNAVVAWDDANGIIGMQTVYADGSLGSEFATNGGGNLAASDPSLAIHSSRLVALSYQVTVDDGIGGTQSDLYLEIVDPSSPVFQSVPIAANQFQTGDQLGSDIEFNEDGSLILTWASESQTNVGDSGDIIGRRFRLEFDDAGNPYAQAVSDEFIVSQANGRQQSASVSSLDSENFVVVWTGPDSGSTGVHARQFGNQSSYQLTGSVLEDVNGDSLLGDSEAFDGGLVKIYRDDGTPGISPGDRLIAEVTTDSSGDYSFQGLQGNSNYFVVVDSTTLVPTKLLNGGYENDDLWAEQTFGDGGAKFGGLNSSIGGTQDDASTLEYAEHVSSVYFARDNISSVDFGFSFNVVTNSHDFAQSNLDGDSDLDRSSQGSLRQFLLNANAISDGNVMRFVPVESSDRTLGSNEVWEVAIHSALPIISDEGTVIDGRAYSSVDGVSFNNANSFTHGYDGTVGVGDDKVANTADDYDFNPLDAPELEIADWNGVANGIHIEASHTELRHVAVHGFGILGSEGGNVYVNGSSIQDVHIHHNIIGSRSLEFIAPNTAPNQSYNIFVSQADSGIIENNLIAFAAYGGIKLSGGQDLTEGANDWEIRYNEIRENALIALGQDGIDLNYDTRGTKIYSNLIRDNQGYGVDTWRSLGEVTIQNNDILANGFGGDEPGGVRVFGQNNIIEQNVIAENNGRGLVVAGDNFSLPRAFDAGFNNLISGNSFYSNTNIGIDLAASSDVRAGLFGDDHSLNGVADDAGAGNLGLDYPELESANVYGDSLYLSFQADSTFDRIEVYVADPGTLTTVAGQEFGQGAVYLGTLLLSDLTTSPTNGSYNGVIVAPTGGWTTSLVSGMKLTTIAIDSNNNTSEFGTTKNVVVGNPVPQAIDSEITAVEDQPFLFSKADFQFTDQNDNDFVSVRIESLPMGGSLTIGGNDVMAGDIVSAKDIEDGNLRYLPNADQFGDDYDTFKFSVNDGNSQSNIAVMMIDVEGRQDDPTITPPFQVAVPENETFVYDVDAKDADGDNLFYTIRGGEDQELFTIDSKSGILEFVDAPDFEAAGDDQYEVVVGVNDGHGGMNEQLFTIDVTGVNDNAPTLVQNKFQVDEGTEKVALTLFDADEPLQNVKATLIGGTDADQFTFDETNNVLTFVNAPDFETPADSDADNNYELVFQLDDGNGIVTEKRVLIKVVDVLEAPVAEEDFYTVVEGGGLSGFNVLWNDEFGSDVEVVLVNEPSYGGLSIESDGSFTYEHFGEEIFQTEFVYQVSDSTGLVDTGLVRIEVKPVDDAPNAGSDSLQTVGDVSVDITNEVLSNDTDPDSKIDGIQIVTQPANGRVFIDDSGKLVFEPQEGFTGETSFQYRVVSAGQASPEAVVAIQVTPPPITPTEVEDETVEEVVEQEEEISNTDGNLSDSKPKKADDRESNRVSDSFADIRNSEPIIDEINQFNSESGNTSTFATYVYATDVKGSESFTEFREFETNIIGVTQIDTELLATSFLRELEAAKKQFFTRFDIQMPSLAMAGTSFLTVGYLAWMVRGGILLTTFMSSVPAWRMLDPMAVLESAESDDAQDDQSIGQLVDN